MIKASFFTLLAVLFISCGSFKKSNSFDYNQGVYLSVSKTGCFGECPIYNLSLIGNKFNLEGYKFFEYLGEHIADVSATDFDEIIKLIGSMDWDIYKAEYKTGYSDLPSTVVQYSNSVGDTTTVSFENNLAPNEIVELVNIWMTKSKLRTGQRFQSLSKFLI